MSLALVLIAYLLFALGIPSCFEATNSITAGEKLTGDAKLVSPNGKFALGFFHLGSKYSTGQIPKNWYLGIWFAKVSKLTPIWIANRDDPVIDHSELIISEDGNLVIFNQATKSMVWSTHATITAKNTTAVLMDDGNLILRDASNSSKIIWQSFDYPTDIVPIGAKFGLDKVTGLNRRLVSKRSLVDPGRGRYCHELDPTGAPQFVFKLCNTSIVYWSTGKWNGQYFNSMPEMSVHYLFDFKFINNSKEEYFQCNLLDKNLISVSVLDISGQNKQLVWLEDKQEWATIYIQPKDQCDIYATCGPFTICNSNPLSLCNCIRGFSVRSPEDWELEDRTGGCIRNTPLDCSDMNHSRTSTTDKFYTLTGVTLPAQANIIGSVGSTDQCEQACLNKCSCTAYSYSNGGRCSQWNNDLLNIRGNTNGTTSDGEVLYIRVSAKDAENWGNIKRGKGKIIGAVTAASILAFVLLSALFIWFLIWMNKAKHSLGIFDNVPCGSGIIAFRYTDLQYATKNFSERIGGGGFGSVFKGILSDSTAIAVKRLDGVHQGEKQFRAEVSSIGIIQHINLIKLIGFCCESGSRLLVYEHMPNHSLDAHIFNSNTMILNWSTRYQIALGVARGLAYLHESCRDCIIHCDIKPANILLDASYIPKIADFGMAKLLGRDFSRVITTMRGTAGYLAPEWISGVAITSKVDVYSYGMMLFEMISGRRNSFKECSSSDDDHVAYFPVEVARKLLNGDIGSLLDGQLFGHANLDEVKRVCKVACWCIQEDELERPTMGEVVQILEGLLELDIPPMPRLLQTIIGSRH